MRPLDIQMPRRTAAALVVGGLAFMLGFSVIWHIYWPTPLALLGLVLAVAIRTTTTDDSKYTIRGADLERG